MLSVMKQAATQVPEETLMAFDSLARQQGRSRASLLAELIEQFVQSAHQRQIPPAPVFASGSSTDAERRRRDMIDSMERKVAQR